MKHIKHGGSFHRFWGKRLPGRVNLHCPMVFLWFSYGFPIKTLHFPMVKPWIPGRDTPQRDDPRGELNGDLQLEKSPCLTTRGYTHPLVMTNIAMV